MNTIQRAIIAAGLVGVLAIVAIVIWGPRTPSLTGGFAGAAAAAPTRIAGPTDFSTYPFTVASVLREQRYSDDALTDPHFEDNGTDNDIVANTTHLVATAKGQKIYVAVNNAGKPCVIFGDADGKTGGVYGCGTASKPTKDGSLAAVGTDPHLGVYFMADGYGLPADIDASERYRPVAPGVWLTTNGKY